jgi:signal transduction histidine kinase
MQHKDGHWVWILDRGRVITRTEDGRPGDTAPAKYLHEAMQGAQKATEISGQMLNYLGLTGGQYALLDLSETCRQILSRLRAAVPENVLIQAELPTAGPHIEANASQIQQVLTNLTNNAGEAVAKNSGSVLLRILTVLAADIPVKQRFPTDWQPQRQAYACMEAQDTGCGIADEDREILFDPFFSKKFIGRGLSLATVLGIAKAQGGAVSVESEFAQGSTFRVFLPLAEKQFNRSNSPRRQQALPQQLLH